MKTKWKKAEMADFLKRIGTLMKRGYSLSDSIELYAINERKDVQENASTILTKLNNGERIYDILDEFQFPNDIVASLYFFEHYDLAEGLIESGQLLETRESFKYKLQKILQYPIFLLWLTGFMIFMLFRYLLPQFTNLYHSIGSELPPTSKIIISSIKTLPTLFAAVIITTLSLFIVIVLIYRNKSPQTKLVALLRIPFVHTLTKLLITQKFSINLSSLLRAGVSINEAIHIFQRQTYSPFFQLEANDIKEHLLSGTSLDEVMLNRQLYRSELAAIIKHGQMNGQLADELTIYAELLFQRTEDYLIKTMNIIQPIIFSIVGLIVLLMFLSVMLPMLQFIQSL